MQKLAEAFESWRKRHRRRPEELGELGKPEAEDKPTSVSYRSLAFGTAGLRGTIGVGTNRTNVYVVAQATQGLCGLPQRSLGLYNQRGSARIRPR